MDWRGQRIRNRYLLGALLGEGVDALVYCAMDCHLGRVVAVKLLRPELCADSTLVERFEREARSASRLNHPNIVPIYDYGKALGTYYLVMEYVRGGHLGAHLRPGQPVSPIAALWLAAHVADALGAAHARGIVHRDVKPANVLLTEEGCPKLTDFGIAKLLDIPAVTRASVLLGTPHYLAPEQASGGAITPATDVYALGVVLYEMLAGRRPFVGNGLLHVAMQHVHIAPPPLADLNPAVPPALAAVVAQTLAKDPAQRFADGAALAAALRAQARALDRPTVAVVAPERVVDPLVGAAVRRDGASGGPDGASITRERPAPHHARPIAEGVAVAVGSAAGRRSVSAERGPAEERDTAREQAASGREAVAALPPGPARRRAGRSSEPAARPERSLAFGQAPGPRSYAVRGRSGGTARRAGLVAAGLGLALGGLVSVGALHGDTGNAPSTAVAPVASAPDASERRAAIAAPPVPAEQGAKPIVTLDDAPAAAEMPPAAPPAPAVAAPSVGRAEAPVAVAPRANPAPPAPPSRAAGTTLRVTSAVDRDPPRPAVVPTLGTVAAAAEEPDDEDAGAADTPAPSPVAAEAPPEPEPPKPQAASPGQRGPVEPPAPPPVVWGLPPPPLPPPVAGPWGPRPALAPVPPGPIQLQPAPGAANRGWPYR
jgi:serine/threonine-protein kinase